MSILSRTTTRVLLIDSDDESRDSVRSSLGPDFETIDAGCVAEALRLFEEGEFDCVLLGIPDVEGLELISRLRSTPVVLFSGDDTRLAVEALKAGARDYLSKEIADAEALRNAVAGAIERHAKERQLLQMSRMEALGRLAGGVAHDFNNMLSAILGHVELAIAERGTDHHLETIRLAAARSAELTQRLVAYGRQQILKPRAVDLRDVVAETVALLDPSLGKDVSLVLNSDPDPVTAALDPTQLQQAIMNLAFNARDAMPEGGLLTMSVSTVELGVASTRCCPDLTPGSYAIFTVSDSGEGIPKALHDKVFEPFFSTKEAGKGTGLGLASVVGFVKQSGGHVLLFSKPGKGSTFELYFPLAPVCAAEPEEVAEPTEETCGETILVVEDEEMVRTLLVEVLESSGYRVLTAVDGAHALCLAHEEDAVDLVLTDVVMPRMSGRDLAEKLLQARPGIKIIFMSGYAAKSQSRPGATLLGVDFLQKPFSPNALLRKVGACLSRRALRPAAG